MSRDSEGGFAPLPAVLAAKPRRSPFGEQIGPASPQEGNRFHRQLVSWGLLVLVTLVSAGWVAAGDTAAELPVIVSVVAPSRLPVGIQGEIRLIYRAPRANVVAVVQAVEDLDRAGVGRSTRQRELGVVARAFGREAGELALPLSFGSPGLKRVTLTLVTDEREESDPTEVEVEATP